MLIFLASFPTDTPQYTWRIWVVRLAPVVGIILFLAFPNGIVPYGTFRGLQLLGGHAAIGTQIFMSVLYLIGVLAFVSSYFESDPTERQRIAWVAVAILFSIVALGTSLLSSAFTNPGQQYLLLALGSAIFIPMPIAIAYAVLHHRVIDVRFAISRGLVYTILSGAVIALFAGFDWLVASIVSSARWAVPIELAAAIATGFWLNNVHERVNRFVDRLLFRQRHEADQRLSRVTIALHQAETVDEINEALVKEPYRCFELTSAALCQRSGDEWVLKSAIGAVSPDISRMRIDTDLCLQLRGQGGALRLRGASVNGRASESPVLAVPLLLRHRLEGIVFYGAHANGGDFDADEVRSLEALAHAAGSAYDHFAAQQAEATILTLRAELKAVLSANQG